GIVEASLGTWLIVFSAIVMGLSTTFIKRLTNADDPDKVVFISTLLMTPVMMVPALYVWEWPPLGVWPYLLLLGPVATFGHVTLARAFAATEASVVMGLDFARLPFAVFYGFIAFGEVIDLWTWIGAAVIFGSTVYIARREAVLKKELSAAQTPRTPGL
ncbi:MAG: DMT family transporter, partial [Hyphomicrobiales bacterium]|nr:DMT family transporter [Hyphomicrobiales bacterium]